MEEGDGPAACLSARGAQSGTQAGRRGLGPPAGDVGGGVTGRGTAEGGLLRTPERTRPHGRALAVLRSSGETWRVSEGESRSRSLCREAGAAPGQFPCTSLSPCCPSLGRLQLETGGEEREKAGPDLRV